MFNYKYTATFSCFLIFVFLNISACENPKKENVIVETNTYTILALGDSYTIGESVSENERWPVQLADSLISAGYKIFDPKIIARTGWTTDELNAGIESADLNAPYDFVFLLIGVNNQYRGRDLQNFKTEFAGLVQKAIGFANNDTNHVFIISIPDWGVMPFAKNRDQQKIAREIDSFNAIKKEEALKNNITFIDITPISRQAATDLSLVAKDGLHPSAKMYNEWIKLIFPLIKARL